MATTKKTKKPAAKKPAAKKAAAKKAAAKTSSSKIETAVNEAIEDVKQEATSLLETMKANVAKSQESAQQAWYVGLGAIGRSADELKSRFEQLNQDRVKLFDELAARGEKVQDEAGTAIKDRRANIDEQIDALKDRMSDLRSGFDVSSRLQDLSDKLEEISKDWKK